MEQAIEKAPLIAEETLALLTRMYEGLSEEEIDEVEKVILDRRDFFSRPLPEVYISESEVE